MIYSPPNLEYTLGTSFPTAPPIHPTHVRESDVDATTYTHQMNHELGFHGGEKLKPLHDRTSLGHLDHGVHPPQHLKSHAFSLMSTVVTIGMYSSFAAAKNYETKAEKLGWSWVPDHLIPGHLDGESLFVDKHENFSAVPHASYHDPYGNGEPVNLDLPATHLTYKDAKEYCKFYGMRLPSEKEYDIILNSPHTTTLPTLLSGNFNVACSDCANDLVPAHQSGTVEMGFVGLVGNVWEMTTSGPKDFRVVRGGSFMDSVVPEETKYTVTSSTRSWFDGGALNVGFRCAKGVVGRDEL
ncbi:hypothetical protein TrVE_jg2535 [Triparma verrucosa]|uniref:Sulfatase-modifying factor enzyme-like domain-containing protein n=1 Tax=Triparma verrucosa TaxID=1606542 RepID=A0A9W7F652_9STRA|nr:hypothetical protein TrVE_jg2535 [Triparma verrucosa]